MEKSAPSQPSNPNSNRWPRIILLLLLSLGIFIFSEDLSELTHSGNLGFLIIVALSALLLLAAAYLIVRTGLDKFMRALSNLKAVLIPKKAINEESVQAAKKATGPDELVIESDLKAATIGFCILAACWGVLTFPALWFYLDTEDPNIFWKILIFVLTLIEVLLLWAILLFTLRLRRFGAVTLHLNRKLARIGGELKGIVRPGLQIKPIGPTKFSFKCTHAYKQIKEGSPSESVTDIKFTKEWEISAAEANFVDGIPISVDIPENMPATTERKVTGVVAWELWVYVPLPGVNYDARFEVPISDA